MKSHGSKRLSRSDRKRRDNSADDGRRHSSKRRRGRHRGSQIFVERRQYLPVSLALKLTGALAGVSAPVLLFLGPETGLAPVGAVSTLFVGLLLMAVTAIGLGAVVDGLNSAIIELRELNAHHTRQWKVRIQDPVEPDPKNDSTDEATASS